MCLKILLYLTCLATLVAGFGETLNPRINVAPPRQECLDAIHDRPCPSTYGNSKLGYEDIPPDSPCPCPAADLPGGGYPGASGEPTKPNPDIDFFVDEVVADGFDNIVAMSFTDNSNELFVGERGGIIWYVNLETGEQKIFTDLSDEVGFSGDRGLMDLVAHPDYQGVKQILVQYTVDPDQEDDEEPHAESAANQRIIRLEDLGNGVINPDFRLDIIGGGENDGPPICYNTHALGAMSFGLDGSLIVSAGEGAHWNFDVGDWGQDGAFSMNGNETFPSLDAECVALFGPEQDVGAWRAQVDNSLSGKILRITPDTGDGLCEGSPAGSGYAVHNPFCDGTNGTSIRSKIWAFGARNPFRLVVRPLLPGEVINGGPGVIYFGDVGQGGYEEVNAVTQGGMNFGWPCWEGPLPSPIYRDSPYNLSPTPEEDVYGCPGEEGLCEPITTIAYFPNGERATCRYMYHNMTTTLPFFYWTRFEENDNAGYFGENGYTGQGIYGATTAGLAFYTGSKYPSSYVNKLFALEFSELWLRVIEKDEADTYVGIQDFTELFYTDPVDGARHTLANGPDGNICYVTMNGGEVRCFRFVVTNVPPDPDFQMQPDNGAVPLTVKFTPSGTFDRENDMMLFTWDFGDGSPEINDVEPTHTYNTAGDYTVRLFATDKHGNSANTTKIVHAGKQRPKAIITSPLPDGPGRNKLFSQTETINFSATSEDDNPDTVTYQWEFQFVHNNHIHPDILIRNGPEFSLVGSQVPQEIGAERVNVLVYLYVTDEDGLVGVDYIRLSNDNWMDMFGGNSAPVPQFNYDNGYLDEGFPQAGQPVRFSAQETRDPDGDRIDYLWDFDDGWTDNGVVTTHTYAEPGQYAVKLVTSDNWGYNESITLVFNVAARRAIEPVPSMQAGEVYAAFNLSLSTVQSGAQVHYTFDGTDPTPCSPAFEQPVPIPYTPFTDLTVKVISLVPEVNPSRIITLDFNFLPPSCNKLVLNGAEEGQFQCLNSVDSVIEAKNMTIPASDGPATTAPPSDPGLVVTYYMTNLIGEYDTTLDDLVNTSRLHLWVSQGAAVGAIIIARVSYDWEGDGNYDRIERFHDFGIDDNPATFEEYTINDPEMRFHLPDSIQGTAYMPLVNGTVRLEIWEAIGENGGNVEDPIVVREGQMMEEQQSHITIPYKAYQFREYEISEPIPTTPIAGTTGCDITSPTSGTTGTNPVFTTGSFSSGGITSPSTDTDVDISSSSTLESLLCFAIAILFMRLF